MSELGLEFEEKKTRKTVTKPKSFEEKVDLLIQEQLDMVLENKVVKTQQGKQKKLWWNQAKSNVNMKIGIYPLFAKPIKNFTSKDKYIAFLTEMKKWREDKMVLGAIQEVKNKTEILAQKKTRKN